MQFQILASSLKFKEMSLDSFFIVVVSDVKGNKRRKISYDFVSTIDQTGGLTTKVQLR